MRHAVRAFLLWLTARLPARIYTDNDVPFLERYFVVSLFGATAYLHRFVASDPDRGVHDHPWGWAFSLVLLRRYFELRRNGELRCIKWINVLSGNTFHRVLLPTDMTGKHEECWTLFVHGPKRKGWGFLRPIPGQLGQVYTPHVDIDQDAESAAWAASAPKGRDLEGRAP